MVDASTARCIKLINLSSKFLTIRKRDRIIIIINLYLFYLIFIKFVIAITALAVSALIPSGSGKKLKQIFLILLNSLIIRP